MWVERSDTWPRIHRASLDNGLRLTACHRPHVPIAAVDVMYGAGSRYDPAGRRGLAHLLEHLMFQGSRNVASGQHFGLLEGAGGVVAASTSQDHANYVQTVPVEQLPLAMWLEADRMGSMTDAITATEVDLQRNVVKNEFAQRYELRPYGRASLELLKLAYPSSHPYQHPAIGFMSDIDGITVADVFGFHQDYYAPSNAVMTVVGDITPHKVLDLAERFFGGIRDRAPISQPKQPELVPGPVEGTVADRVSAARIYVAWRVPPMGTRDHDALTVLAAALGHGRGSSMFRSLVHGDGIAQPATTMVRLRMLCAYPTLLVAAVTAVAGARPDDLTQAVLKVVEHTRKHGICEAELARARLQLYVAWHQKASTVAGYAGQFSRFEIQFGNAAMAHEQLDRWMSVGSTDIEAAMVHLQDWNRVILTIEPE